MKKKEYKCYQSVCWPAFMTQTCAAHQFLSGLFHSLPPGRSHVPFGSKDFSRRCATTSSIYDRFFDYLPRWSLSLWERRLYLRPGGETHIESVSEPALWWPFSHFEPERWTLTCIWQFLDMLEMQLLQQFLDLTYVIMTYLNQNMRNIYKWLRRCKM